MKIMIFNGSLPQNDLGLRNVLAAVAGTLTELGMEIDEVNLGYSGLPYYDGTEVQVMNDIAARIKTSAGIIFASPVRLYAPGAMLQVLLEYFEIYNNALHDKHCMFIMVSKNGGERSALDYVSRAVSSLGGIESGKIGLQEAHALTVQSGREAAAGSVQDIIEKEAEDFYRAVRQNRRYITPADVPASAPPSGVPKTSPPAVNPAQHFQQPLIPEDRYRDDAPLTSPASDTAAYNEPRNAAPVSTEVFSERQEQDIKELTALFSQKYVPPEQNTEHNLPSRQLPRQAQQKQPPVQNSITAAYSQNTPSAPKPKVKSIKQLTQSLPHYYQPQMAAGLTAVIQLSITGTETFDGYLTVVDNECDYTEGFAENPEITIISDSSTWGDVLKGKHTAQRAFMIGGLKVRGNFVLLTKFDTLFKL